MIFTRSERLDGDNLMKNKCQIYCRYTAAMYSCRWVTEQERNPECWCNLSPSNYSALNAGEIKQANGLYFKFRQVLYLFTTNRLARKSSSWKFALKERFNYALLSTHSPSVISQLSSVNWLATWYKNCCKGAEYLKIYSLLPASHPEETFRW